MGFFNKIFGNKEQAKAKDESKSVPVKEEENVKPESNNELDHKFNPADKFDPTKVNSAAAANVNNAEPVGKVDESQFRFRSNDPAQNIQQGQQQMALSHLLVAVFHGKTLGALNGLQRFLSKLIEIHEHDLLR